MANTFKIVPVILMGYFMLTLQAILCETENL